MARQIYDTVSGVPITYEADPKLARFIQRVADAVDDRKVTENEVIALVYSSDNPILDHELVPGRSLVTREVLDNDAYHVLADLLWRKTIQFRKLDLEKLSKRYSITVKEAAAQCGVTEDAVRQAIRARRVACWKRGDQYFLDPKALGSLQKSAKRGPMPTFIEPLRVRAGGQVEQLHIHHPGGLLPEHVKDTIETTIPRWRRVAVLTAGHDRLRMFVIEPADEECKIDFHGYHVHGKFKIVEKVNGSKAARLAWEAFQPL